MLTVLRVVFSLRAFLPNDTAIVMLHMPATLTSYLVYHRLLWAVFTELI